ncbi:MAG: hypothetical protein M1818_001109 [Claussenomyces sp. TS43310]|nr:MAG: hypothetical protein M1818_001109 [Claussenomyces sp. TS43310]
MASAGTTTSANYASTIAMRPTQFLFRRLRRLALTTKQANKGFYKGTGSGSTGRHTKHGGYIIEWEKVRTYCTPVDLKVFGLTPFVTKKMPPTKGHFERDPKGALSGSLYLQRWKDENGED